MKNLIGISTAFAWFALCVVAAVFLLTVALTYNGALRLRGFSAFKKIELPRIQIAK